MALSHLSNLPHQKPARPTKVPVIFTVPSPFDNDLTGADAILRSSDGLAFHVHTSLLGLASPFFKDLFSLPQPLTSSAGDVPSASKGIPIQETGKDLYRLLCWCDPRCGAPTDSIDGLLAALNMAKKYDMMGICARLERTILLEQVLVANEPLQAYALAMLLDSKDAAKNAARQILRIPHWDWALRQPQELSHISGAQVMRLQRYFVSCAMAATGAVEALARDSVLREAKVLCSQCSAGPTFRPMRVYLDRVSVLVKQQPCAEVVEALDYAEVEGFVEALGACQVTVRAGYSGEHTHSPCFLTDYLQARVHFKRLLVSKVRAAIDKVELMS